MLRQRIISAFILALAISFLIFFISDIYLIYIVALISSLSLWEFLKVRFTNTFSLLNLLLFMPLLFVSHLAFFSYLFIGLSVLIYLISLVFILSFPLNKTFLKNSFTWAFSGFIIHLGFFASIYQIISTESIAFLSSSTENERLLILYIALISILMDSIAYFAGKSIGKKPFIANVSPNKTMEGFLIAIVTTPLILAIVSLSIFELSFFYFLVLLFIVSLYSVLGDALASMMKRVIEIKDFSNLIPGHGGLFDRLDSHIAAFPCFIFLLSIF